MKKLLLTLAVLCGTVSGWADLVKIDNTANPALPGELKTTEFTGQNYKQYHFTSQKFAAPANFNTLRLTFMANSNNEKPAGYPCVAIAEFYLYDKNGDKVALKSSNFSSNATLNDKNEGSVDALFDGVVNGDINAHKWYWHSEWKNNVGEYHYLEINVANLDADLSEFSFGYVTRREQGSPTEILVTTGSSTEDVGCQYSAYRLKNSYNLSTQAFRIRNANITSENLYMTIETPNSSDCDEGGVKILAKTKNNDAQAFKFISQADGTFYIKSENEYHLNSFSEWGFNAIESAGNSSKFTINYIGHGEFRLKGTFGFVGPNNAYTTDHAYELFSNHGADKQYIDWILEPYVTPEYDVVYNYNHDSKTMITEKFVLPENTNYPVYKSFYGVTIAETTPTGQVTEDVTFNFTCTVDESKFPFAYAPDVASIETWQYIQMHSNQKKFLKYESNYISWSDANLPLGKTDAYAWTFVGNPFVGFKMLNKAATTAKALKSTNSGNPAMANYAEATSFLAASSAETTGTGYFCMRYPGGNYLNAQNGKVAHWSSNDAGSTMVVNGDFVEMTLEKYLSDLQTLIGQAEDFVNTHNANRQKPGYYGLDDVQADIDAAKETLTSNNMDEVDVAFLDLQEVLNAPEVNLPVAGKFYRIENNNASGYLSSGTGTGRTQFVAGIGEQASSIFCYTGGKLLSYTTGLYLAYKTDDNMLGYTDTVGEAAGTTIGFAKSPVLGKLLISFNNGNRSFYSNAAGESNGAGAGQTGDHYRFTVTEVEWLPVPMNVEAGYATLYSPVALSTYNWYKNGRRVEAYTGVIDGEKLSLTRIDAEDGIIPANTPVVLKYVADINNGNVFLQVSDSEKAAIESDLKGTLADAYISESSYVLSNKEGIGFYRASMNQQGGSSFLNNGFKAYLPANGNNARALVFDFGTETGIDELKGENGNVKAEVYDLAGRRVQNAQKGVFIVNGKVVVK